MKRIEPEAIILPNVFESTLSINDLPLELLVHIFSFLPINQVVGGNNYPGLVCQSWHNELSKGHVFSNMIVKAYFGLADKQYTFRKSRLSRPFCADNRESWNNLFRQCGVPKAIISLCVPDALRSAALLRYMTDINKVSSIAVPMGNKQEVFVGKHSQTKNIIYDGKQFQVGGPHVLLSFDNNTTWLEFDDDNRIIIDMLILEDGRLVTLSSDSSVTLWDINYKDRSHKSSTFMACNDGHDDKAKSLRFNKESSFLEVLGNNTVRMFFIQ